MNLISLFLLVHVSIESKFKHLIYHIVKLLANVRWWNCYTMIQENTCPGLWLVHSARRYWPIRGRRFSRDTVLAARPQWPGVPGTVLPRASRPRPAAPASASRAPPPSRPPWRPWPPPPGAAPGSRGEYYVTRPVFSRKCFLKMQFRQ